VGWVCRIAKPGAAWREGHPMTGLIATMAKKKKKKTVVDLEGLAFA
jgi:hypothetical protein